MIDFWIDFLLTILVTFVSVFADWLANRLISSTRRLSAIKTVVEQSISDGIKIEEIKSEISRFYSAQESYLLWGSDLAAIAFALDLVILGIWITDMSMFPFFSNWNGSSTSREIPIWLILIFFHFFLLLCSIVLKQIHSDYVESIPSENYSRIMKKGWIKQNKYFRKSAPPPWCVHHAG